MLSNEEFKEFVNKEISSLINEQVRMGCPQSESEYLDTALDYLKKKYTGLSARDSFPKRFFYWGAKDISIVTKIWEDIKGDVARHISDALQKSRSRRMVTEIKRLSAEVLINEAFTNAGFKYMIFPQTHRSRVHVKIGEKNKVIVYISYKNAEEDLEKAVSSIKTIIAAMEDLGKGASIQKIMPYEKWK
jgi:hypothetical protein